MLTAVTEPYIADEGQYAGQTVIRVKKNDGEFSIILLEDFVRQKPKTRRGLNSKGRATKVYGSDGSEFPSIRAMNRKLGISFFAARKAVKEAVALNGVTYSEDDSTED